MRVCISTYCEWSSYGSVMQALGLKKCLSDLGHDSFIIRDVPAPLSNKTFPFQVSFKPKKMLKQIVGGNARRQRSVLYANSVKFIREHLDIRYFNDYDTLCKCVPGADFYLAGSDQIWNPKNCRRAFLLDFLPLDQKRLSYAASMGTTQVPEDNEALFAEMISKFDSISVREEEMIEALRPYTEKKLERHIDPTFLVDTGYWRELVTEYPVEKPYILAYAIYWDKCFNDELKRLHKQTGYDVVALCPAGISRVWANKKIYDADPGQFLYLIQNAEAVVSSSFHGVALAINFNKKVAAVVNPESPSRIGTLMNILGVEKVPVVDVMKFDRSQYEQVNRRIEEERARGIQYLKEVLQ